MDIIGNRIFEKCVRTWNNPTLKLMTKMFFVSKENVAFMLYVTDDLI